MISDDYSETDDSYYAHCPSESLAQQLVAALNQFFSDCFSSIRAEYQVIGSRPAFILKDTNVKSLQLLNTPHLISEFSRLVDTYQVEKNSAASIKIPKL